MPEPTSDSLDRVRVGIIGLGRAGWALHARVLRQLPDLYTIVAVADALADRVANAAAELNCNGYLSAEELIGDRRTELVVVAVPTHEHTSAAIHALKAGKHVLVEKPVTTSIEDLDRMIRAGARAGCHLIGSQNLRYTADFRALVDLVGSGQLGELLQIKIAWHAFRRRWDWQTLLEWGGGAVLNDGSHAIDQALLLLGERDVVVECHRVRTPLCVGDAEDHAKILLRVDGGPSADIELSNSVAFQDERWRLVGTCGGAIGGAAGLRWRFIEPSLLERRAVRREPSEARAYDHEVLSWIEGSVDFSAEKYEDSHRRLYQDVYPALRSGAPCPISTASLRRQISILEQCLRSPIGVVGGG